MPSQFPPFVERLIQEQMATGRYASEEDLLVRALNSLARDEQELRAVEEGLASVDAGEPGTDAEQVFRMLREKHRIQD